MFCKKYLLSKNRKRRNIEKGKILCNRKPANYPNYIWFLELIIPKQNEHTLGVRLTALLLEKTTILNTGLKKQLAITLDYTFFKSLHKKSQHLKEKNKENKMFFENIDHSNWYPNSVVHTSAGHKDILSRVFIHVMPLCQLLPSTTVWPITVRYITSEG